MTLSILKAAAAIMLLLCFTAVNAQQVKGTYDPVHKTFFARLIDESDNKRLNEYKVTRFYRGMGVAEHRVYSNTDPGSFYYGYNSYYGVIDTAGNIHVPFADQSLYLISQHAGATGPVFFTFTRKDTIGIITSENKILFSMPRLTGERLNNITGTGTLPIDLYFRILQKDGKKGVFSLTLQKAVVPIAYDRVMVSNKFAVGQKNNKFIVTEYETGRTSQAFDSVFVLKDTGPFLVYAEGGKWFACSNIFDPWNTPDSMLNRDGIVEYFNDHFIVRSGERVGVLNSSGEVIIPFDYDDIYALTKKIYSEEKLYFWVKKGDSWAICDQHHQYKTPFEFQDIDKFNKTVFTNFVYLTQVDTSSSRLSSNQLSDQSYFLMEDLKGKHAMLVGARRLKDAVHRHIIAECMQLYAKKNDGYHLLYLEGDSVTVDKNAWSDVYTVHPYMCYSSVVGVRKGKKYGYLYSRADTLPEIKYHGLYFIPWYSCSLYWSDRDVDKCPYAVIKGRHIFYHKDKYDHDHRHVWRPYGKYRPVYNL